MKLTAEQAVAIGVRALSAILGTWLVRDTSTSAPVAVAAAKDIEIYIKGEDGKALEQQP